MQRKDLEGLSRDELIAKAEELGVVRPRSLTIPELIDEILLATEKRTGQPQKRSRGWFGRARDLLTSVIDRGLSEPSSQRDPRLSRTAPTAPAPLPTVTLAEIYAAQGHFERAITTLDEVIARDESHAEAKKLRERFVEQLRRTRPSAPPPPVELKPVTLPPPPPAVTEALFEAAARAATVPGAAPAGEALASTVDPAAGDEIAAAKPAEASPIAAAHPLDPALAVAVPELLDERYDVDEIVAIAVDPHTVYAYWEVRPTTLAEARAKAPDGALVLRIVAVASSEEASSPRTEARDVRVDALSGDLFLRDVPANANVRVTIGWKAAHGELAPLAVGLDLATPRETPSAEVASDFARFDTAGVADVYDALRAAGLTHTGPGAPHRAFGRTTPEEVALGHGSDETFEPRLVTSTEHTLPGGATVRVETRLVRGGASELSREEIRFFGASDQARREVRFFGASENVRGPRPSADRSVSLG